MKTVIRLITFTLTLVLIVSCTSKPVKTIGNLKDAYNGESTASVKYAAYAEKAKADGLENIAVMFHAISKSESIHAENHKKVLEKLGEKVEAPTIAPFTVLSTAENLTDAIKGETYEVHVMYPEFIMEAKTAKANDAVKSFTWAVDTEKKHLAFYTTALEGLNSGAEKTLPLNWFVCPVCGNTFDAASVTAKCDFCLTPKEKFLAF
ncbi:MAG TPA: ferritin family protein [Bacteroidales bacterium]